MCAFEVVDVQARHAQQIVILEAFSVLKHLGLEKLDDVGKFSLPKKLDSCSKNRRRHTLFLRVSFSQAFNYLFNDLQFFVGYIVAFELSIDLGY